MSRIEEIKNRLSKATKGEWVNHQDGIWSEFKNEGLILIAEEIDFEDAEFIANSKSDIEYLIKELEIWQASYAGLKMANDMNLRALKKCDDKLAKAVEALKEIYELDVWEIKNCGAGDIIEDTLKEIGEL